MKHLNFLFLAVLLAALYSCQPAKEVAYFQDIPVETTIQLAEQQQIKLQPGDKITIVVSSKDPQLASLFTLTTTTRRAGSGSNNIDASGGGNGYVPLYTVLEDGTIDFPVLGTIPVAGMSRLELAKNLKERLISTEMIKDPIITVEYANLSVYALGEISRTGEIAIDRDRFTILDAIAKAGDLSIQGKRKNITVLRTEGNVQNVYKVDLTSMESVVNSPVYYMKQGDIIYVEPTQKRANDSTINGNSMLTPTFWISLASSLISLGTTIAVLLTK